MNPRAASGPFVFPKDNKGAVSFHGGNLVQEDSSRTSSESGSEQTWKSTAAGRLVWKKKSGDKGYFVVENQPSDGYNSTT